MSSPTLTSPGVIVDVTVMIASSGTPSELPENRRPARAAARQTLEILSFWCDFAGDSDVRRRHRNEGASPSARIRLATPGRVPATATADAAPQAPETPAHGPEKPRH
jgi:hypothetical protein